MDPGTLRHHRMGMGKAKSHELNIIGLFKTAAPPMHMIMFVDFGVDVMQEA